MRYRKIGSRGPWDGSAQIKIRGVYWLIGAQVDGEVESFERVSITELIDRLIRDDDAWKPNVGLVLTDFLVRHGALTPELPGYLKLVGSLRQGSCS